ncbi:hypothetical protein FRB90_008270, partial [Tulasnella sp. 427]
MALNSQARIPLEDPLNPSTGPPLPSPISTHPLSPSAKPLSPASHRSTSPSPSHKRSLSPTSPPRKRDRLFAPFSASRRAALQEQDDEDDIPYTEEELREIFEEEEIQRFLSAFHA